jgi:hypothetical protein
MTSLMRLNLRLKTDCRRSHDLVSWVCEVIKALMVSRGLVHGCSFDRLSSETDTTPQSEVKNLVDVFVALQTCQAHRI